MILHLLGFFLAGFLFLLWRFLCLFLALLLGLVFLGLVLARWCVFAAVLGVGLRLSLSAWLVVLVGRDLLSLRPHVYIQVLFLGIYCITFLDVFSVCMIWNERDLPRQTQNYCRSPKIIDGHHGIVLHVFWC